MGVVQQIIKLQMRMFEELKLIFTYLIVKFQVWSLRISLQLRNIIHWFLGFEHSGCNTLCITHVLSLCSHKEFLGWKWLIYNEDMGLKFISIRIIILEDVHILDGARTWLSVSGSDSASCMEPLVGQTLSYRPWFHGSSIRITHNQWGCN